MNKATAAATVPTNPIALASMISGLETAYWSGIRDIARWLLVGEIIPLCQKHELAFYGGWHGPFFSDGVLNYDSEDDDLPEDIIRVLKLLDMPIMDDRVIGQMCESYAVKPGGKDE